MTTTSFDSVPSSRVSEPGRARRVVARRFSIGSPRHLLNGANVGVEGDVLEIVLKDLADRGLVESAGFGGTMTARGAWRAMATERGRLLLEFVQLM